MIPIKLTIQGLYSYQEKQTIDFTKLTSANLFGIFGAVGSGKSSILEAITYAIYGDTDRMNSRDSRNYNMMNLKSNELLIEFEFETGKNQTAYRAVVKGRRNSKKFEDVKSLDRTAYRRENGNWIPIEPEVLGKAIGLSYDNFKRTIIIPQGQFQEFLQLGNKDRSQMMMDLFSLKKFELLYKVTSLESKNNAQKQNFEGQLQQLGAIDAELVKQYEEQLDQAKTEIEQIIKSLAERQMQEAEWKQLHELVNKLADTLLNLRKLKDCEPEFALLETTIRNYEHCLIQFKSLLDAATLSNQKILQKTDQIEKEVASLKRAEEEIALSETVLAELKIVYDKRDLLKQQADELTKIARLNVLSLALLTHEERLKKGNITLEQTVGLAGRLKLEKESLELLLKAERAKLPDLAMLSKVKTWHVENKNLHQQWADKNIEIQKFKREIVEIEQGVKTRFSNPVFTGIPPGADAFAGIQFLKVQIELLKKKIAGLDNEMEHYRVQAKLEEYAVNLTEGEACPLCGSLHHPTVFSVANMAEAMSKAIKNKEDLEKEVVVANENISQLSDLSNRLKFNFEHHNSLLVLLKELDVKVAGHKDLFHWDDYKDEAVVSMAFTAAETIQKVLKENEEALSKVVVQLEKEILNKEKFQAEIEKINMALTISQTEIKTLSEQIRLMNIEDYFAKTSTEIETEKQALMSRFALLEQQFNDLTHKLNDLRKTKDTVRGSLEANRKELFLEQKTNAEIQKQLSTRLQQADYLSLEDVKRILAQEMDLEFQKQKLVDFKHQLALLQSQEAQLNHEIANRTYESEAHKKLIVEIATLIENLNLKNKALGKIEELLSKLRKDLESQALLHTTLENIRLRAENIKTMKSLFTASGFVNYISSVYLQNLCHAANDRFFQLTRQKLSLEITEDNSFQVRDYLNGGKVRSVKTLSGGQTFQAALSLALALADNIQKITESNQNFFFLDEGFGSLDKDSLSVVFDALKSLRKENRIVGVISHVEEMQQEIDTHLRIVNLEEAGSRILASWE